MIKAKKVLIITSFFYFLATACESKEKIHYEDNFKPTESLKIKNPKKKGKRF